MCYCCNLCNRCGRADQIRVTLGKRLCVYCGAEAPSNETKECPECGEKLPPPFPAPAPPAHHNDD